MSTPNVARIYDYLLGGDTNFPADRHAAEQIERALPNVRVACRANRDFLGRAVTEVARSRRAVQFLDIGSGLPTQENVHQVAQRELPDARIVYVDNDPVVCSQSRRLLGATATVGVMEGDMRDPDAIVYHPAVRRLIDFRQPVCLIMCAAIQFVPDDAQAAQVMAKFRDALPAGSVLIYSHGTRDWDPAGSRDVEEMYRRGVSSSVAARTRADALALLDGWDLVDPGFVWLPLWRPQTSVDEAEAAQCMVYGGVAVKAAAGP